MKNKFFKKGFLFLFILATIPLSGWSQTNINIKGLVTDAVAGEPLIGVSVAVKGVKVGTITDIDGRFSLSNVSADAILVVSYVGYATKEVQVNGQSVLTITMEENSKLLDEIVVVGYGTMRKKDLTGSITQIRPDKIANENPKTVQDVLRGTPGLYVGFDSSAKGGGQMQIRGQRSTYNSGGHNDPLIILDGMIFYGELSEINPDDIGQIDVLKDASAAAVYGAKSANGVIIISTKKGQMGKPVINLTSSVGFTTMAANREVFSPEGYLQYREDFYTAPTYGVNPETGKYEAYQSTSGSVTTAMKGYFSRPENLAKWGVSLDQWRAYTTNASGSSDNEIRGKRLNLSGVLLDNFLAGKTFDWYDYTFRTGVSQDHNISLSGASDRINYYMSAGYLSNEGVALGNEYSAVRANLKLNGKVNNWLEIGTNVNFQDRTDGDITVDWNNFAGNSSPLANSPYANYKDENGNLVIHPMGDAGAFKGYNYDFNRQYQDRESGFTVLNTIFTAKVSLPFNITYSFNVAPRYQWKYYRYFESSQHPDWPALTHGATRENAKWFDWSLNNTLAWDYTFNRKHHVTLTLVQEAEERRYWWDQIQAKNILPTDALGFHEVNTGDMTVSSIDSQDTHETADGMLARAFYSYDDRYAMTTSIRRDGHSAFGTSNPRATFTSLAAAWTFTNEKFFQWKPMSMGKLRLSWGQNGNRALDDVYVALANLSMYGGYTQGYVDMQGNIVKYKYLGMDRLANPHFQWEKTTSWNTGLDFGFLDNRITGSIDYYVMPTTDMIMSQTLPAFSGVSSIISNLGEVENRGFELSVTSQNIKNKNFEWNTTFSFTKYKNTIKHLYYEYEAILDAEGNIIDTKETDDVANKWFIGHPISSIWDYRVTGIWQADEATEAAKYGQRPGDPKVANNPANDTYNEDGTLKAVVYNNDDKEFLGQTAPPIQWSMRNDFTLFKNFNFSFNIYSYMGHKGTSTNYLNQDNGTSLITNGANIYAKEYWTPDNPTNDYARLESKGPTGISNPGMLYDRSFIRLENVSLAYTLPSNITKKWNIEKVKIYGSIRNAAVWAKEWKYWDPETGGLAPRVYTLGLNLIF